MRWSRWEGSAVVLVAADLRHAVLQQLLDLLAGGVKGGQQVLLAALVGEDQPLEGLNSSWAVPAGWPAGGAGPRGPPG